MKSYDVIIVGAGVMGMMAARDLAQLGTKVLLLDKSAVGQEASWAGGGIISPLYPWRYKPEVTELALWSQSFYPELAEDLLELTGIDIECVPTGMLMMNVADQHLAFDWAEKYLRAIERVDAAKISQIEPHIALQGATEGVYLPEVANVRNPRLLKAMAHALHQLENVDIHPHEEVLSFEQKDGYVNAVVTAQARYKAAAVVVTCGAWTSQLLKSLDYQFPIKPFKGEMLLYKTARAGELINSIVLSEGKYLIPRKDGHIIVGSTLEDVGFDKSLSDGARETLQEAAERILPALKTREIVKQWSGLRPGSPHGVPLIGKLEPFTNLYLNAGQFRNGLVLAPASTHVLTSQILGRTPMIEHSPYSPSRFMHQCTAQSAAYY